MDYNVAVAHVNDGDVASNSLREFNPLSTTCPALNNKSNIESHEDSLSSSSWEGNDEGLDHCTEEPGVERREEDTCDEMARLLAILAGLPIQTVPDRGTAAARQAARPGKWRGDDVPREGPEEQPRITGATTSSSDASFHLCSSRHCSEAGNEPSNDAPLQAASSLELYLLERAQVALKRACLEYPTHVVQLRALTVVHASLDLVCLADHASHKLFVAARGTDKKMRRATLPRDLGNDAMIFFGFAPVRVKKVALEYQAVCERLVGYQSYGTGHSLGASVMEWLAVWAEADPHRRPFTRIDLFNPGSSPLRNLIRGRQNRAAPLKKTEVHSHRVLGDIVSRFHTPSGPRYTHPRRAQLSAHALGHFMPQADEAAVAARTAVADMTARVAARVAAAQAVARVAVASVGIAAVSRVERAQEKVAFAEATAAADALGHPAPRPSLLRRRQFQLSRSEGGNIRWNGIGRRHWSDLGVGSTAAAEGGRIVAECADRTADMTTSEAVMRQAAHPTSHARPRKFFFLGRRCARERVAQPTGPLTLTWRRDVSFTARQVEPMADGPDYIDCSRGPSESLCAAERQGCVTVPRRGWFFARRRQRRAI